MVAVLETVAAGFVFLRQDLDCHGGVWTRPDLSNLPRRNKAWGNSAENLTMHRVDPLKTGDEISHLGRIHHYDSGATHHLVW